MRGRGETNPHAKLTAVQVVELRERAALPGMTLVRLARDYGITPTSTGNVVTGRTWRHVGGPVRAPREHRSTETGDRYCRIDGFALEHGTNGRGQTLTRCPGCERRRAQRCMDCGRGTVGRAWRCPPCKATRIDARYTLYRNRNRAELNRRALARVRAMSAADRLRRLDVKKAWRDRNVMKRYEYRRRARLAGKPNGYSTREKYETYQRAYRESNREHRRKLALAKYYELHPTRPAPICRECGAAIPFSGVGRPRVRCASHHKAVA